MQIFRIHSVVRYREHEKPEATRPHHVTRWDIVLANDIEEALAKVKARYDEIVRIYSANHLGDVTIQ